MMSLRSYLQETWLYVQENFLILCNFLNGWQLFERIESIHSYVTLFSFIRNRTQKAQVTAIEIEIEVLQRKRIE